MTSETQESRQTKDGCLLALGSLYLGPDDQSSGGYDGRVDVNMG